MAVERERIRPLNDRAAAAGGSIVYLMEASVREACNPALEYAVATAHALDLPLRVVGGVDPARLLDRPASAQFELQGWRDVAHALERRRIDFAFHFDAPEARAARAAEKAAVVVCDGAYLPVGRAWRDALARQAHCEVIEVESNIVVPAQVTSTRHEFAARTIRPKVLRHRAHFQQLTKPVAYTGPAELASAGGIDAKDVAGNLRRLGIKPAMLWSRFAGGTVAARDRLSQFLRHHGRHYGEARSDPASPSTSMLSPWLRFGHISPVEVVVQASESAEMAGPAIDAFLEQLIVRRELAINHVLYEPRFDRYDGLPEWARQSLDAHRHDPREIVSASAIEAAETPDPHFNAAMQEMLATGYMHNYMRMYWGKRILEWLPSPEAAFDYALALNNRGFLDGDDPLSYTNVGWVFGLHDRPFAERSIFGKVRYMNAAGLKRKFDINLYIDWASRLAAA